MNYTNLASLNPQMFNLLVNSREIIGYKRTWLLYLLTYLQTDKSSYLDTLIDCTESSKHIVISNQNNKMITHWFIKALDNDYDLLATEERWKRILITYMKNINTIMNNPDLASQEFYKVKRHDIQVAKDYLRILERNPSEILRMRGADI